MEIDVFAVGVGFNISSVREPKDIDDKLQTRVRILL
jgi:hypothetical protein